MPQTAFSSVVNGWAEKSAVRQTGILHESIRLLVDEVTRAKDAGGNMPVLTGNLRNSVAVSTTGPVAIDWKTKKFRNPSDAVNNAVAGVAVGETAWVGFRAPYAHKAEVNNAFARLAAQRWPQIVAKANLQVGQK